mmetsp:Transcript_4529/g.16079  ORF Transcript_4529/g.16079 Transcript_4529/m.16079 type:complete len:298 (-) Transcript_4529:2410-3303(-)
MTASTFPAASAAAFVATGRRREFTVAWSYMIEFIMPYSPSDTKYWCESSPGASDPSSVLRILREKIMHASVTHASAKYRPGSEMTRTPSASGKRRSRDLFTSPATAASVTSSSFDASSALMLPLNPPPMSSTSIGGNPSSFAASNATRANSSASRNASGFVAPEPTWNDTPFTLTPSLFAASRSTLTSAGSAPYLFPSTHRASGSSARRRRRTFISGASAEIFSSSPTESNVVSDTPLPATAARCRGSLHGFAYMIRSGDTPREITASTSVGLAQSNDEPSAASVASTRVSMLHFTA